MTPTAPVVRLEPWSDGDLDLLRRLNTPEQTAHVGGPETDEKIVDRHRRYLDLHGVGRMFRVVLLLPEAVVAGSIGYWEREWQGATVWETGWSVLPEFQGRGVAAAGAIAAAAAAGAAGRHRHLHAYPSVGHPASNAVCRRAGFTLRGEVDFEYPPGIMMRCHDWRLDLTAPPDTIIG